MVNLIYLGVARVSDKCPIADYAAVDSKEQPKSLFDEKFTKLLFSCHLEKHRRLTITDKDVGHIHYESDPALLFMVITAPEYPQSTAFKFLTEARIALEKSLGDEMSSSKASGLSKQVKLILKDVITKYEDPARADKLASVVVQVEQVKSVMQQNIQAALKNQDNLETLLNSSDSMRNEATSFNRSTNRVRKDMQWKNTRMWLFIIVLLICLVAVAVVPIVLRKGKEKA